jgi:arsenite-transporting ATPase
VDNCFALEIDTRDTVEQSKRDVRERINWFLKSADITTKADDFVEAAAMSPAFEESAMFENMLDILFRDEYDFYVFDTAPAANARRLLGMSRVYSLWVEKMLKSREEAKSLHERLSFSKKKEQSDPLADYLLRFRDRVARAGELLTDSELTSFFFVTLPESLPIAVTTRFMGWVQELGMPVGGVIVNGVIGKERAGAGAAEFIRSRVAMQTEHMEDIGRIFGENVRAVTPLLEAEIKGIPMLGRAAGHLFATDDGRRKTEDG